jgi:hypothetical protein
VSYPLVVRVIPGTATVRGRRCASISVVTVRPVGVLLVMRLDAAS